MVPTLQPDQGLNRAETAMLGAALAAAPEVPVLSSEISW